MLNKDRVIKGMGETRVNMIGIKGWLAYLLEEMIGSNKGLSAKHQIQHNHAGI